MKKNPNQNLQNENTDNQKSTYSSPFHIFTIHFKYNATVENQSGLWREMYSTSAICYFV